MSNAPRDPIEPIVTAPTDRPFVIAQLGQSLDGRIATVSGESRWINGEGALDHLHRLRAAVDAVLVGVGTVIADDPRLNVRRTPLREGRKQPARIVIDPSGRLPGSAQCLTDDGAERIVVTASDSSIDLPCTLIRIERDTDGLCPRTIVTALFNRGFRKILVEGGAQTISRFIDAGAVDRLHVMVAPMIIGSGKTGLELTPVPELAKALRPPFNLHLLDDGNVLFDCDLAAARGGSQTASTAPGK